MVRQTTAMHDNESPPPPPPLRPPPLFLQPPLPLQPVSAFLSPDVPSKTSVVFTLPNTAGALYKALACFSLREVSWSRGGREANGGLYLLLALVIRTLTTHPFPDGAPFLLLIRDTSNKSAPSTFLPLYYVKKSHVSYFSSFRRGGRSDRRGGRWSFFLLLREFSSSGYGFRVAVLYVM